MRQSRAFLYGKSRAGVLSEFIADDASTQFAYSLRRLSVDTVYCVRLRRSTDDVEKDFSPEDINDGTVLSWTGSSSAYVTTIYDQSTNAYHMTQPLSTLQGRLVDAGFFNLLNDKPIILRSVSESGGYISSQNLDAQSDNSFFFVGNNQSRRSCMLGSKTDGDDYFLVAQQGSSITAVSRNVGLTNEKLNSVDFSYLNRGEVYTAFLSQVLYKSNPQFFFNENYAALGYRFDNPSILGMYNLQEMILYNDTLLETERTDNINRYYNIY